MRHPVSCEKFEDLALLYALGELDAPIRAAVEEHARVCPPCTAVLQREIALAEILAKSAASPAQEPSDLLLARCRSRLGATLDTTRPSRPRPWATLFSLRDWVAAFRVSPRFHPAWSVAALLLIGVVAGLAGWQGIGRAPLERLGPTAMTVLAAPPPSDSAPAADAAPAPVEAAPQPAARDPLPAEQAANDVHVYSATDAGMNPTLPRNSFQSGSLQDQPQRQPAGGLRRDQRTLSSWRNAPPPRLPPGPSSVWEAPERGRLARLSRRMESLWWGGVRIDPAEQQQRLVHAPAPEYPDVARRAGIEGPVTLLLRVGEDGAVQETQLVSGEPVLGRAAAKAVEQWRYSPLRIGGSTVSILTSVTFDFRLR